MKALLALIAMCLTGCSGLPLPIKGKVCYQTGQGEVCLETDGTALTVLGNVKGYSK